MTRRLKISTLILLISFVTCSDKQTETGTDFARRIVKSYFDKDCKANFVLWNNKVRLLLPGPVIDTIVNFKDFFTDTADFCENFISKDRIQSAYTFGEYLNDFEIRVYPKKEFTNQELMGSRNEDPLLAEGLFLLRSRFNDNDYLFVGNHLKNGDEDAAEKKISHWRSWIKIISRTKDGWKITGTMP